MKKFCSLLYVLVLSSSFAFCQNEQLISKYSTIEGVEYQAISKAMIKVALLGLRGPEKDLFKSVKKINILDFSNASNTIRNSFLEDIKTLDTHGIMPVADTVEDDCRMLCYAKMGQDAIEGIFIITIDTKKESFVSMELIGKIPITALNVYLQH